MRLLAGLPVTRADITGMGVGGLLMEIVTRPQPRAEPAPEKGHRIAGDRARRRPLDPHGRAEQAARRDRRQAAGAHRRRAGAGLARQAGRSSSPAISASGSSARSPGLPVTFVHNPDFADGLVDLAEGRHRGGAGGGRRRDRLPRRHAAGRAPTLIDRLIAAFDPERGALVVVPTIDGKRGNPVLWSRRFFPDLMAVEGDVGARHLIGGYAEAVVEVPVEEPRR